MNNNFCNTNINIEPCFENQCTKINQFINNFIINVLNLLLFLCLNLFLLYN